ncbi:MAG TPA: hypothetical protein VF245_00760 [Solirubrobacterales bacterium]
MLPLWLIFLAGTMIESSPVQELLGPARQRLRRRAGGRVKPRRGPARWVDGLVDLIARHKAGMLAFAVAVAIVLSLTALFIAFGEHEGHELTHFVADIGGYVAIVGLVLGFPALCYAMVTDRAVENLRDELGISKPRLKSLGKRVREIIANSRESVPDDHHIQIFVPNPQRTRGMPLYDPDNEGPEEGWIVDEDTPQAVTGSAWVEDKYLYGVNDRLSQPKLRLTAEQLKRYEHLTGVAAAPIHDGDRKVGVLTIFTDAEHPIMTEKPFRDMHRRLAKRLAPVIREYVPETGALEAGVDLPPVDRLDG